MFKIFNEKSLGVRKILWFKCQLHCLNHLCVLGNLTILGFFPRVFYRWRNNIWKTPEHGLAHCSVFNRYRPHLRALGKLCFKSYVKMAFSVTIPILLLFIAVHFSSCFRVTRFKSMNLLYIYTEIYLYSVVLGFH